MKKILTVLALISSISLWAQDDEFPSVNPTAVYVTFDGEEVTELEGSQSAPLKAHFYANPQNVGQYSARYEWKIWKEGEEDNLLVHRFEEEIEYTFAEYGSFRVQLYATFVLGNDTIPYPQEGISPMLSHPMAMIGTRSSWLKRAGKVLYPSRLLFSIDGVPRYFLGMILLMGGMANGMASMSRMAFISWLSMP